MRMEQGFEKLLPPEASRDWREGGVGEVMNGILFQLKTYTSMTLAKLFFIALFKILIIRV